MQREPQTTRERAVLLLRATLLPGWHPTATQGLVWALRGAIVLGVLVLVASAVGRGLWDWLDLLVVPAALAIGVFWLNRAQRNREREAEEAQQERERKAQAAQRKRELEVENQRAQDAALQAYLDQMGQLLLDHKLGEPVQGEEGIKKAQNLARARTLTVLERLDGAHKRSVVQFLHESKLILRNSAPYGAAIINLAGADLSGADLSGLVLIDIDLSKDRLLGSVNLSEANLSGTWLQSADLSGANLSSTNLSGLSEAELREVDLTGAQLFKVANLRGAGFSDAQIIAAEFTPPRGGAAMLLLAILDEANLTGATVTGRTLTRCKSLEGATMPNGQKYEDWRKSREEENNSP